MLPTSKARFKYGDKQDTSWMLDARCRDMPHEESLVIFFPDKGQNAREGKRICNGTETVPPCPVREECLAYALSFEPEGVVGIFGGTTSLERRELADEAQRIRQAEAASHPDQMGDLEKLVRLVSEVHRGR